MDESPDLDCPIGQVSRLDLCQVYCTPMTKTYLSDAVLTLTDGISGHDCGVEHAYNLHVSVVVS